VLGVQNGASFEVLIFVSLGSSGQQKPEKNRKRFVE
jgi:hypothetical protein